MSTALLLKLTLAPSLVGIATLAVRRYGPAAGGWWASAPVVVGPVLLAYTLDHGDRFGAASATTATLGLASLSAFTCVYALVASRGQPWPVALLSGYLAYAAMTAVLSLPSVSALEAVALAVAAAATGAWAMARAEPAGDPPAARRLPGDLPLRMAASMAMVLLLSALAGGLGPGLSGLLAPFPIIGSVMAVFTHLTGGPSAVRPYAAALLRGLPSCALALATVAEVVEPLGTAAAFVLCAAVAAAGHAALITLSRRSASQRHGLTDRLGGAARRRHLDPQPQPETT